MKIKNKEDLAKNDLRRNALEICEAGLEAINTRESIKKRIKFENNSICVDDKICLLDKINRVVAVGVGKNSTEALSALGEILGDKLFAGIAFDTKEVKNCPLTKTECYIGTHPSPSKQNVETSKHIVQTLTDLKEDDLVLFVISGGGSTLLCLPDESASYEDEVKILKELFKAGANIEEINTVRKHLSFARGGFLAKCAYPAQVLSLIFSDVPGNNIEFIASGPTVKDTTTTKDAENILNKYHILKNCGLNQCGLIETPKEEKYFERVTNILFMSNDIALNAMLDKAKKLGLSPSIQTNQISGEAKDLGRDISKKISASIPGSVHLYGGESTVIIKGSGKGGRNQELALGSLSFIQEDTLVLSINSDGRDNTDHAGALCDIITKEEALKLGLDLNQFLENNDSYEFFMKTEDFIDTGDTNSNISDLIIAIKK